jgi:hypothetical protein
MADEKVVSSSAKPTKPPSLLDLSRKKALSLILSPNYSDSEFTSLEPHLQKLLFRGLRTEIARLQEIKDDWTVLERSCPSIDLNIYRSSNTGRTREEDDISDTFWQKWSYIEEGDGSRQVTHRPAVRWDSYSLFSDPDSDLLRICSCSEICGCAFGSWKRAFYRRISSQLLLYRLTILFGMPPPVETDGYKACWEAELRYSDGVSILTFRDYKGAASTSFMGSAEASTEALRLVNYLISIECCHTYDGIRAGRVA